MIFQGPGRQPGDGGRERRWRTSDGAWKYHERPKSFQVGYKAMQSVGTLKVSGFFPETLKVPRSIALSVYESVCN